MASAWTRLLRAAFVLYLAGTAVQIGWVVTREPFFFDAWNVAVNSGAKPITPGRFFAFWKFEYTHSNPRVGQVFAYLAYKLEYFAVIATPLAYLAISLAVFVLGTARLPSWKRGRDLALWAIAIGSLWFALPQIGKTMFCRAYCTNYVYAAAIQLWFVAVLRLAPPRASQLRCIGYALFGIVAGACNEHTGPTLIAFMIGYAWWLRRSTGERPTLVWSGALGALIGFLAIFFAPGQGERYEGLGQRMSLVGRLLQRGFVGNLEILRDLMLATAPTIGLILIAVLLSKDENREAVRKALRFVVVGMLVSVAVAVTIFVSPKLGPRFFYVGCALVLAGFIGVADAAITRRKLIPFVLLAVTASIYAGERTIPLYNRVKRVSDSRMAALAAAPPGSLFVADAFEQIDETWWFYGDDLRDGKKREMVATYFALEGVELQSYDPKAPLGVSGARLVPHYEVSPESCIDQVGGLTLGPTRGFDLQGLDQEIALGVDKLRRRLGNATLHKLDVAIEVDGPMPHGREMLVARWTPAGLESHHGRIERKNLSRTRLVKVPKELALPDVEIIVYQVGGEARSIGTGADASPHYVPWKSGVYWILACRGDACFVIAATKHSA